MHLLVENQFVMQNGCGAYVFQPDFLYSSLCAHALCLHSFLPRVFHVLCFEDSLKSSHLCHWQVTWGISERQTSWPNHSCSCFQLFIWMGFTSKDPPGGLYRTSEINCWHPINCMRSVWCVCGAYVVKAAILLRGRAASLICANCGFVQTAPSPQWFCILIFYNCPPTLDQRVACCNQLCAQHHKWARGGRQR